MANNKKQLMGTLILMFIITLGCGELLPYMKFNGSGSGFNDEGQDGTSGIKQCTNTIEDLIITGAGYFLRSQSEFLLFLQKVELSSLEGVDYTELGPSLRQAVELMELANHNDILLNTVACSTPYRQEVIEKLRNFDYEGLQLQKGLNAVIFKDVEYYLKKGDIRGVYSQGLYRSWNILSRLYRIDAYIDAEQFPPMEELWRLNQDYNSALMFGQYTAEVFAGINN